MRTVLGVISIGYEDCLFSWILLQALLGNMLPLKRVNQGYYLTRYLFPALRRIIIEILRYHQRLPIHVGTS